MLELARKIGYENNRMKHGVLWQSTLGIELAGKTLGLLGLGKLGSARGEIGKAIRHEPDRLEREPHAEKRGRRRRRWCRRRTCSGRRTSSPSISC